MISDNLIALRKRQGMSQQEVAASIGVTRQTISNWELGQGSPALDKATELARLYGVSLDDLAGDGVSIVTSGRAERIRDLHILSGFVGKTVDIELMDADEAYLRQATVLDVSEGWMRVEREVATAVFGKPGTRRTRAVQLIDIADIGGIAEVPCEREG